MEKRILVTGIVLAVSIITIIGVFFIHSNSKDDVNPITSVPQDAAFILKINGMGLSTKLLNKECKVWDDIIDLPIAQKTTHELKTIDSLIKHVPAFLENLGQNSAYVSGHITGGRKLYFLTVLPLASGLATKDIVQHAENSNIKVTERKYEGKAIVNFKTQGGENLNFCIVNGLLMYSKSPVLIENAIRQTTLTSSLLDDKEFLNIYEATGKNKVANFYFNLKSIGVLSSLYANNEYVGEFRDYNSFGTWAELDITIKEDLIMFNGFSYPNSDSHNFVRTISSSNPVKITIPEVLPSNISGFIAYGISSPKSCYSKYKTYINELDKLPTYKANLDNMNQKYGIEFHKTFIDLLDDQLALAYKDNTSNKSISNYLIFKCKSGQKAKETLEEIAKKIKLKTNGELKKIYSPDNEIKFSIYHIPIYPLFGRLIGEFFNVFDENYLFVVENYLVVAGSYKEASQFLNDYMLKHTLTNNNTYVEFAKQLSMKSFLLAYANTANSAGFFEKYLSSDIVEAWEKQKEVFHKAQSAGFQISEVSDLPYFNLFLKHQDEYRGKPQTVWESLLDTTISQKPKFVTNHYTKQNEIVVQDNRNNLYLINQAGRILWKTPLDEKINSTIEQVDFYKNGKLQLLFSTKSALHMIDRNGNYVERYPVKLRADATAGMSLFDYESNKNYRIFIPCADKKVYAYSKEGDIINGWKFGKTDHDITQPVEHFRVAGKDFIVFGDKTRTYILDRKGNYRIKPQKEFSKSLNNSYYIFDTGKLNTSYIATTNTEGSICKIFLDGKTELQSIKKLSPQHFFDFKDVNADGINDYILLDDKNLTVYTTKGELIYEKSFKSSSSVRPVYYHFSYSDRKIGIVTNNKQIHLINNNGENYKGFPLEGTTQFTVGYFDLTTSRFNLIVGGRNNFLYNYAVE